MMTSKAQNCTVEEIIDDLVYWESIDDTLQVTHDGNGTIEVGNAEWTHSGKGPTLKEALINYGKSRRGWNQSLDYE